MATVPMSATTPAPAPAALTLVPTPSHHQFNPGFSNSLASPKPPRKSFPSDSKTYPRYTSASSQLNDTEDFTPPRPRDPVRELWSQVLLKLYYEIAVRGPKSQVYVDALRWTREGEFVVTSLGHQPGSYRRLLERAVGKYCGEVL